MVTPNNGKPLPLLKLVEPRHFSDKVMKTEWQREINPFVNRDFQVKSTFALSRRFYFAINLSNNRLNYSANK